MEYDRAEQDWHRCSGTIGPKQQHGSSEAVKKLAARQGRFSETFSILAGSAIKIARDAFLSGPLTTEYTLTNDLVYYDISNNAGNPFSGLRNKLVAADDACPMFNCAPGDSGC